MYFALAAAMGRCSDHLPSLLAETTGGGASDIIRVCIPRIAERPAKAHAQKSEVSPCLGMPTTIRHP